MPTVRHLLSEDPLKDGSLIGGGAGIEASPLDVVVVSSESPLRIPAGSIVVVGHLEGYRLETLLRRAYESDAYMVVSCNVGGNSHLSSTRVLSDRLSLPLVTVAIDPLAIASALWLRLHAEQSRRGVVLARIAASLRGDPVPSTVVKVLDRELDATCAVLGAEHVVLAGSAPHNELELGSLRGATTLRVESRCVCVVPVRLGHSEPARLWVTAETGDVGTDRAATIEQSLSMAANALAVWAATARLQSERETTFQSSVLGELLSSGHDVSPRILAQAVTAGWQIEGWHTGCHLLLSGWGDHSLASSHTADIRRALKIEGLDGPLVAGADGWSFWLTKTTEPDLQHRRELFVRLNRVVAGIPSIEVVAGLGGPRLGPRGLAETLIEARELSRFAGAVRGRQRVVAADETGVRRFLAAALSDDIRARSLRLLAPLLEPFEPQLFRTLEIYLDLESSSTSTAARLGVHRNTVTNRLARIESLLQVNLGDPDVRLAVQIACRAK